MAFCLFAARSSFEEPIAWLVAAGCFCSAAILSGLTAWLSFYMTTNAAYRLLQLINMGICFTSLPGTIYCALLLIQIIRETDTKISLPSWTNVETADERALQSLRVLATVVYFFQVILMGFQAFVGCCMLTRFPYLWSTPTWKRDSLTSSWHINCRRPVSNQLPLLMK
ncbi:hypothetical protein BV898_03851 [Hypsibius exemplaris]|uniref:Uncharacterized protein n=1 Tax=Hypsibius exemplaris TaxID=2072580 RepID=A0A1W0X4R5_HYPEX|nr:hypothetical protein BV898_03851 [Hypsibius exemplaris]